VLRRIFGPKGDAVTGEWIKLHNEELRDLYSSSNKREELDERGMQRVWGRGEACIGFWWGNRRERDHWLDPGVVGKIILRWVFRKWDVAYGLD